MKNLHLPLKRQWFDMSEPNGKNEEYREITDYWWYRLVDVGQRYKQDPIDAFGNLLMPTEKWRVVRFKGFRYNIMTLGYPKKGDQERTKIFEHAGIEIRTGKPEWGATPNKLYFVIKHGKQIQ